MSLTTSVGAMLASLHSATPVTTLIRVGRGMRLAVPVSEGVAALLVLSGQPRLGRGGRPPTRLAAGQLVFLAPGQPAELSDGEPAALALDARRTVAVSHGWMVAGLALDEPAAAVVLAARIPLAPQGESGEPLVTAVTGCAVGRPIFRLLQQECAAPGRRSPTLATALMTASVIQALHRVSEAAPAQAAESPARGRLARAIAAIREQPAEPHSIERLAALAGMSRSTFVRQFGRTLGCSPLSYVQKVRLGEARTLLLSSDMPVKAIAARTGFASRTHFSRAFRAAFGRDPRSFREEERRGTLTN